MPNGVPFCTGFKDENNADLGLQFVEKECLTNLLSTSRTNLWLWGYAANGRLGNNSTITRSSPVQTLSTGAIWKQMDLGYSHSAAIKTDGTLWLWGRNAYGNLGNNSTINQSSPVQTVSTVTNWKQVSLGQHHSAAIKTDGTLWLWGGGGRGRLGNNSTLNQSSPVQTVSTGTNWKQVDLGRTHSAAVKTDGTLWLWGYGSYGVLGTNSTTNHSSPVQTVSTGTNWKQVSLGCYHSAAIKTDGTLWLWGRGSSGRLGNNSTTSQSSPVQTVFAGTNWKQVSLGQNHSAAVKTDGTLWLWGDGGSGRLGTNTTTSQSSPVQTVSRGTNWKSVGLGEGVSTAIKTDGTLWLWGNNTCGSLGINSITSHSSPVQTVSKETDWLQSVASPFSPFTAGLRAERTITVPIDTISESEPTNFKFLNYATPVGIPNALCKVSSPIQTVSGGTNWLLDEYDDAFVKTLSSTNRYSSAIKTDGTLWLWACNLYGALGNNSTINQSSPVQTVTTGTNWKQVSLGGRHSASIKTDGTLWLWGLGSVGRLGNNSTLNRSSPVQTVTTGTNWKQVALGYAHSAAVKTDGTLWLWGTGYIGMLGNNTTTNQSSPVQTVSTGTNWKQVSLGSARSAAIKTDGTLWLWGQGDYGALGTNTTTNHSSPVQTVSTGTNWKQVSFGLTAADGAAIKTDGTLWLWGKNEFGRLGNNSTLNQSSPVQTVTTGTNWKQVSSGGRMSVVKTDGTLWTWGFNNLGGLGDNTTTDRSSPVQTVSTGTNWKQTSYLSATKTDGTLWLWGYGSNGRLGNNTTTSQSSPVQTVSAVTTWSDTDECAWCSFSINGTTTAAVKSDGTLWLWGSGANGRLGDNSTIRQFSPVQTVTTGTNWKQVSLGQDHSAAIKTDGTLWLWGYGAYGRLGNNSVTSQSSPVQTVSTGTNWKQVNLGGCHSAAIKTDGTLWLWGQGCFGSLGNNSTLNQSSPVQTVTTGTNWKQVALGLRFSAAIKTDGTLWLWGRNSTGNLGTNTNTNQSSPVQTVSRGTTWKQVSLGAYVSAATKTDGTLWLWGRNSYGRLGNNSVLDRSSPVQTVSTGTNWKQVSAGFSHSAAIKTDGTLWLWGHNLYGNLGTNTTTDHSSPVQTVSTGTNWKQVDLNEVSSGPSSTVALTSQNELYGWGSNYYGQLGQGRDLFVTCCFFNDFDDVFVRKDIFSEGGLWLWGNNNLGRLGNNSTINQSSPVQTVSRGTNWKQVALGREHSAAVKTDGTLWLWGEGSFGRLGNIATTDRSSPVQTVSTGTNWKQVALGCEHSAAVKTDGTLWLWGENGDGRLGTNSATDQSSPVQTVTTGTNWKQVALGYAHSAAVKTDGTLWLWGTGTCGRLGTNSTTNHSSPVQTVTTGTNWKQVALDNYHSAAVKTDGTLWLWGRNFCGALGNNSTINQSSPVQTVSTGTNWKQVALSRDNSAAVKTDGTLWLWGNGEDGRLGTNAATDQSSPVQTVTTGTNWKQVALGYAHSAAVKTDGTLWLWGEGSNGRLGNNSTIDRFSPVQTVTTGINWKQVALSRDNSAAVREDCW